MSALQPFSRDSHVVGLSIRAQWERTLDRGLIFRFRLEGPLGGLVLPTASEAPAYREGLWQHSCFEVFMALPGHPLYWEWNFSPSGDWACFEFTELRQRTPVAPLLIQPEITVRSYGPALSLEASLDTSFSPTLSWALQARAPLEASATTVLEHADGTRSYWATHHPGEKPDFHRRDGFILRV